MSKALETLRAKQAALAEKMAKLKSAAQKIEDKQRKQASGLARRRDTRKKILIGSAFLADMETDPAIRDQVTKRMSSFLTREDDRALFGLPGGTKLQRKVTDTSSAAASSE